MKLANVWFGHGLAVYYFVSIDGQFLLKSNQLGPFPLAFSVRPDTFLARTVCVCAVTPALECDPKRSTGSGVISEHK